jgi:hypothetical protein
MAKKKPANLLPKLTEAEQDLLSHIQDGYQLETNSLGSDPVLRRLSQAITVVASAPSLLTPDPAQSIIIHDQVLDANPGRPGAPISIPGLPIETASGGIKAPQYFAPGVAGDHGEPIAQYFQVGDFLYPNNLPANAHGNGYADPNFLIPPTIETVTVDGGEHLMFGKETTLSISQPPTSQGNASIASSRLRVTIAMRMS